MRMAVFWKELPTWLELLLWFPFTTSAAGGTLLFAFSAVFPRRVWSKSRILVAMFPGAIVATWHLYFGVQLMRDLGPATGLPNAVTLVFLVNVSYAAMAVVLLASHRRAASTLTDQRRIGVLILGTAIGAAAALGVIVGYWQNPGAGIFATWWMTVLSLIFLAMPASFAYAILRHRLFDVRLIVRQGLQYALACRFVDALLPVLGALVLVDVILHRDQRIASLVQARWSWYILLGAALVVVRSRREKWLRSIDRRFFRERYDAQRLLTSIADQVARASSFDAIAPAVVQQLDEALHPTFVSIFEHEPAQATFSGGSGRVSDPSLSELPSTLTVIGVLGCCGSRWRCRSATPLGFVTNYPTKNGRCSSGTASSSWSQFPPRSPVPCRSRLWCSARGDPRNRTTRKTWICFRQLRTPSACFSSVRRTAGASPSATAAADALKLARRSARTIEVR